MNTTKPLSATRRCRRLRALTLLLALVALTAPSFPALAQDAESSQDAQRRAIDLIKSSNAAYDAGDFRRALVGYRQAYELTEDPRVLYRIGLTYENLLNYQRAREHLELYLLAEPESKYAGRIKAKVENLRVLEGSLQAAVRVESNPPGARVWMEEKVGKPLGTTPLRVPVGPGEHVVIVALEGREPVRETIQVEAGAKITRSYDLGGGAVGVPDVEEQKEANEKGGAVAEADPDVFAAGEAGATKGEPLQEGAVSKITYVDIGPPVLVSVISWPMVVLGPPLLAYGMFAGRTGGGLTAMSAGAGATLVGGYLLWIHDWSGDLPDAQGGAGAAAFGPSPPAVHGIGYGFEF